MYVLCYFLSDSYTSIIIHYIIGVVCMYAYAIKFFRVPSRRYCLGGSIGHGPMAV